MDGSAEAVTAVVEESDIVVRRVAAMTNAAGITASTRSYRDAPESRPAV